MAEHRTEAACLLETGAKFGGRLGLRIPGSELVFLGVREGGCSIYFGDEPIYHFDLDGRWQRIYQGGTHFLKGFDATTVAIDRVREGANLVLKRRELPVVEAGKLDESVLLMALSLLGELRDARVGFADPPDRIHRIEINEACELLERIARWDASAWSAQTEDFRAAYAGPMPFLPPGCEQAVVWEATVGHQAGVGFGGSAAPPYYARSQAEFRSHVDRVVNLWGRRLLHARTAFLGGGDVLVQPIAEVAGYLCSVKRFTPSIRLFLDDLAGPMPSWEDLAMLKELGLERIELGVESGSEKVRQSFGKFWSDDALPRFVGEIRSAGLEVGIVLLVGAGGLELAETHLSDGIALIDRLDLGPKDFVSLVDIAEVGGKLVLDRMRAENLTPLSYEEISKQQAQMRSALLPGRKERGGKVVAYSLEKQSVRG